MILSWIRLLIPETMKLIGTNKGKITKDENGEIVNHLEITEVVLVHCNIVNKNYQQNSRVLYTSAPNKLFGQFLHKFYTFKKPLIQNFHILKYGFTDQNSKLLEIK